MLRKKVGNWVNLEEWHVRRSHLNGNREQSDKYDKGAL